MALLFVGCNGWDIPFITPDEPAEVTSAEVVVVEWEQAVVDGELEDVIDIDYLITNTGTVDIDFSNILFEVTYEDFTKDVYLVWIDGIGAEVGLYERGYLEDVWVGNREVANVDAVEWELASYDL